MKTTFILFIFLIIKLTVFTQQKIPLQHNDYNEIIYVSTDVKVKPKDELQYFWFKAKEVHNSYGACEGKPLVGEYKSFYKSQQLRSKGYFKKGLKDDLWVYWSEAGKIIKKENYKNGVLNGSTKEYVNGEETTSKDFKNGVELITPKKDSIPEIIPMEEVKNDSVKKKTSFNFLRKKDVPKAKVIKEEEH